ncbi:ATP-binding protein [Algiphilus sp. NNCM1]|nr:ATP-binding protein [Algiphilus acroporae]
MSTINALAHPEKRLFIHLLTRDISLVDAFLDIIDNSVNAALQRSQMDVTDAATFEAVEKRSPKQKYIVKVHYRPEKILVEDNCGGMSSEEAQNEVFVFGAQDDGLDRSDKLSVYGIGLKRALFKFGRDIKITSDHVEGGFSLDLDVSTWERTTQQTWSFPIEERSPVDTGGTSIKVSKLHEPVAARLRDSSFETELVTKISRTYSFFLDKVVSVELNGKTIRPDQPAIGANRASEHFNVDDVTVYVVAGLGAPKDDRYTAEQAGWNIYCNGRSVLQNDKSTLTGWGIKGLLPSFQPKHRPFVGMVFFSSESPESLPWTTTKLGVNPDNHVWQRTLRRMAEVGRQVIEFLDRRYGEEGTTITSEDLSDARGNVNRVDPSQMQLSSFKAPTKTDLPTTSIQYRVDKEKLKSVKKMIGRSSMSNSEVGRYTFDYFFDNEVD